MRNENKHGPFTEYHTDMSRRKEHATFLQLIDYLPLYLLYSCSNFFLSSTPFKLCKYKSGFWKKLSVATSNFQSFCDKQLSAVFSLDCVKIMN
uniref:Uncharacterized protein n=1 Tax=Anguilla anguilla TaxID=7936 RepID=A0A0E9Q3K8_ANGAN